MSYKKLETNIERLKTLKKYPQNLYYEGNLSLLDRPKVSVVGARKPISYSKRSTFEIASKLANAGTCIVSGAAMGIDAIAHEAAGYENTIAVFGSGIDINYPSTNAKLIKNIRQQGLVLSQFEPGFRATRWSFVLRNEIVVALGDILVVAHAELDSGSLRSVEFALDMGKEIYVLPHRLNESKGTNALLQDGKAKAIYDIDDFVKSVTGIQKPSQNDEFLNYCKTNPTFDQAVSKYSDKVFEYELEGKISVQNGIIFVK